MPDPTSPGDPVLVSDSDNVRTLVLNRPDRKNAFDQTLYRGLAAALDTAANEADVHCVVLTGAGTAFTSGQDLEEMAALARGEVENANGFSLLIEQLENYPKPLLAAVNGAGVGFGLTLLLHCDIVVMGTNARLKVPFSELGVPPEAGSSALLVDRVGWQRAAEILFTSCWIDGPAAVDDGLALRVTEGDVVAATHELASVIASQVPSAVSTAKRLMLAARGDRAQAARERESAAFVELFAKND